MADIYVNYGTDIVAMVGELMQTADIAAKIKPAAKVCIKPNLVIASTAEGGATTHPEIVEGIIIYLQQAGVKDITIAEGSWVGDSTRRAYDRCGYNALGVKYGVRLVDTKQDKVISKRVNGSEFFVCETIENCDYLINVPVLKGHCQTIMTCCLKNMKGCIPDKEKRRFHAAGLHKPIATLNTLIKPDLNIVDSICGDLNFEEGGNPVQTNRIMLGFNSVLLDSYGAGLMGYRPDEIEHLRLAREYGVGEYCGPETEILELGTDNKPAVIPARGGTVKRLAANIQEDSACSACYAALIFALKKTGYKGEKIKIGQGYKDKTSGGIGVGNCTSGCANHVKGCPPSAVEIVKFLENM